MSHPRLRAIPSSALLVVAVAVFGAPAAAQVTPSTPAQTDPALQSLLWPSWSGQVAALGLAARAQLPDSAAFLRPSDRHCQVGSTAGLAAGLVAETLWSDALSDLMDISPRQLFHDAPALSSLDQIGEAVGQALFCPSALARSGWGATGPLPAAAPTR